MTNRIRSIASLLFLSSLIPSFILSQPRWSAEILKAVPSMTFDESASEGVLLHSRDVTIDSKGHAKTHVRTMTKVLKTPGPGTGVMVELKTPGRDVKNIKGWRILSSGTTRELEKSDIVEVAGADLAGTYDEGHTVFGRFPGLDAGDIVMYEYDIEDEDWPATHQTFSFQVDEPVHSAKFSLTLPDGWDYHKSGWNISEVSEERTGNTTSWSVQDLPFRQEEKLMPPWSYLERRLNILAYKKEQTGANDWSTWEGIGKWAKQLCETPAVPDDKIRSEAQRLTAGKATALQKIEAIADFVRDQVRYVAVEVGRGRWEPHVCSSVLYNKYGDCKDKATLMRGLLASAGIPSSAVLANSSYDVHPDMPSPFQFNHMIVAVPVSSLESTQTVSGAVAGRWLFFDPTDEAIPFGALPIPLQGSRVLVAEDGDSLLVRLPYGRPVDNRYLYRGSIAVAVDGSLDAALSIIETGGNAYYLRHELKTSQQEEQLQPLRKLYATLFPEFTISEYKVEDLHDSVAISFKLQAPRGLKRTGSTLMLRPMLFTGREFPVLGKQPRHLPLWFGGPRLTTSDISIKLPAGWKLDGTIPAVTDSCLDVAHLSYSVEGAKNLLHFTSSTDNTGRVIEPADYEQVRTYGQQMRKLHDIVLILQAK